MFCSFRNDGWMLVVIATNTTSTAMMPNSLIRNTRSVSRRELTRAGGPDGSRRSVTVALTSWPPSRALRWLREAYRFLSPTGRFSSCLCLGLAGGRGHDLLLGGLVVAVFGGQPPLAHD